jgi:hypothetical protein
MVSVTSGPGGTALSNQLPVQFLANCLSAIQPPSFCVLGATTALLYGQFLPVALNRMTLLLYLLFLLNCIIIWFFDLKLLDCISLRWLILSVPTN